jgi:uncharacterized membrane protein
VVSAYLLYQSFNPSVSLICPTRGVVNCEKVTESAYSHIFGIPVAALGVAWFVLLFVFSFKPEFLFPLWVMGAVFVGYLVFSEFLVGAICVYCTFVHVVAIVSGVPAWKLSFSGE